MTTAARRLSRWFRSDFTPVTPGSEVRRRPGFVLRRIRVVGVPPNPAWDGYTFTIENTLVQFAGCIVTDIASGGCGTLDQELLAIICSFSLWPALLGLDHKSW